MAHRTLLVATPGGHIDELFELVARLDDVGPERLWVTAETPQTNRVLACEETAWVPPVGSRQSLRAVSALPSAFALLRNYRPSMVISTGAALAIPYLVAARAVGVETHYIESATRLSGPSMTGCIVARLPGINLHHQGFRSARPKWQGLGSVFDAFQSVPTRGTRVRSALVTLGTERFPFSRALERVSEALSSDVEMLVQTGHTPPHGAIRGGRAWVPADELHQAMRDVDLVVTHAGVGSVLAAFRAGKHPVIMPRVRRFGEHVDDHQLELAEFLSGQGLATVVRPGDDLRRAIAHATRRVTVRAAMRSTRLDLSAARETP